MSETKDEIQTLIDTIDYCANYFDDGSEEQFQIWALSESLKGVESSEFERLYLTNLEKKRELCIEK